jgi:ribosomal peptide maturation radical SAM protein 1
MSTKTPPHVADASLALGLAGPRRILLVCPPFQHPHLSSLSTAHLGTLLRERGGRCVEAYPHFVLAELVGVEKYLEVGDGTSLTGELLFAEGLHGEPSETEGRGLLERAFGSAVERRGLREEFERRTFARLDCSEIDLVGLTTSFNQLMAALWLSRAIKRRWPSVVIALGGAACAPPMGAGILAAYPHLDVVVSGWGEAPLLALSRGEFGPREVIENHDPLSLDALPVPDYGPFLQAARDHEMESKVALTFEGSRGCWWGQKHHCRFCGVNGTALSYHAKTSSRVIAEIRSLWERHGRNLVATDAILSREHLRHVMPELSRWEGGPKLFYELKTNMKEAELGALARARVQCQPGVESLSTRLCRLLRKGTNSLQNLAFLKWVAERNIPIVWNLLYAIPGEVPEDYDRQIALFRWIPHFPPPERINPIHLARHSPYFDSLGEFGWSDVEPRPEYRSMHPHLGEAALRDVSKYFVGHSSATSDAYLERLARAVSDWRQRHQSGEGLFLDREQGLVRNGPDRGFRYQMTPLLERVLERTHQIAPVTAVLRHAACARAVLDQLEAHGIVRIEDDRVLNLTVRTRLTV